MPMHARTIAGSVFCAVLMSAAGCANGNMSGPFCRNGDGGSTHDAAHPDSGRADSRPYDTGATFDSGARDTAVAPTCSDGIQNGTESGVDCGGSCPACSTCSDGVRNGDETGVDCGGSCLPVFCPTDCHPALPVGDRWERAPDPSNPCLVPYTTGVPGNGSCPSPEASIADCLSLPRRSNDPRRDCFIRAIRLRGRHYETDIASCLTYDEACFVSLAERAGVPTTCTP